MSAEIATRRSRSNGSSMAVRFKSGNVARMAFPRSSASAALPPFRIDGT
jgi:hypothetical protein